MFLFIKLLKPNIILGNIVSMMGGFFLSARGTINWFIFFTLVMSLFLVIASSCIINNIFDRDVDVHMVRTKNRLLVVNCTVLRLAIIYSIFCGTVGFLMLYFFLDFLSTLSILIGFLAYIVLYTFYAKRKTIYATFIGAIAGAMPPLSGYLSVTHNLNQCALILFLIFYVWQIPHFYSISLRRLEDYKMANIPIFVLSKGVYLTKCHIVIYILLYLMASSMLTVFGYTGWIYFFSNLFFGILWLLIALLITLRSENHAFLEKILFLFSIIVIVNISIMMSIDFHT
ncbi:MAG: heme o synthase [Buchnera aphidicola (Eriosoma harunire)]